MLHYYDFYLRSNPLATKMLTNLAICCSGDIICQTITKSQQLHDSLSSRATAATEYDWVRVARFGAVGACV